MLRFENGYSASLEIEGDTAFVTIWNPAGDICDRAKFTGPSQGRAVNMLRIYADRAPSFD